MESFLNACGYISSPVSSKRQPEDGIIFQFLLCVCTNVLLQLCTMTHLECQVRLRMSVVNLKGLTVFNCDNK
jgi:hypothetical protein